MQSGTTLSAEHARWLAIDAQGLGRPRPAAPTGLAHLRRAVDAISNLQLDAINVVARTQFLVLFSRVGAYDTARLHTMTGPGGELFEYWGHAASLIPVVHQPLFRWRMTPPDLATTTRKVTAARWIEWGKENADYLAAVLEEVRERGPIPASQLKNPRRSDGEWWDRRSLGRSALEYLFKEGDLAAWRAPNFERVYDVPERVIPAAVLAQPTPTVEEAHRALLLLAARALGVATVTDLATYWYIQPTTARARIAELVEEGALVDVAVEGWKAPAYALPTARPRRPTRGHATLLSPFDPLIWERARTKRLFGFDYTIEVYVPAPKRVYGYYVLPLLMGDSLVGRFDLKADRATSVLRVQAAHIEPGRDSSEVATAAARELDTMREWLGLGEIVVARKGNLATALRRAVG